MNLPLSNTEQYLAEIVKAISTHFGEDIKKVTTHGGRFTAEELKRLPAQVPAIFVSLVKLPRPSSPLHATERVAHIAIAVVTKTTSELSRDDAAIRITTELTKLISGNNWGINTVLAVDSIPNINNIYSANIDRKNIAMWSLDFNQLIQI